MDKQSRRDNYEDKKNNKDKYKVKKQVETEQDKQFLKEISMYSPEKLLKFLEDKYDDYVQGNQKFAFKLNNEIGKRLAQIPTQIDANQYKKLLNILQAEQVKVSDQNLKKLFDNKQIKFDGQNLKSMLEYPAQNVCLIKLVFNDTTPNVYVRKVCISKVPQELYHNPLNKRMKKQSIEMIEGLLSYSQKLNDYEKN